MPYTTLVPGTVITASWANANVRDQVLTPFASAATRDATITSPVTGMHVHHDDHTFYRASSGIWAPVAPRLIGARQYTGTLTSTGAEVAMAAWTTADPASVQLEDKHFFMFEIVVSGYNDGTANALLDNKYRLRTTVNSILSQQIGIWRMATGGGASPIITQRMIFFGYNASGGTLARSLGITVQKSTGTNAYLTGNTTDSPTQLFVWDMGSTSRVSATQLSAMLAVSIT